MTFIDILKYSKGDKEKKIKLQNAFAKIITQRMPELKKILTVFGWKDPLYNLDFYYGKQKPRINLNLVDLAVPDIVQHPVFESVRNDRLKLEILVDYDIHTPSYLRIDDYFFQLRSIEVEIVLTLGDRQIFKQNSRYHTGFYKILREISELNHDKEMWKDKNIYTTNRFSGLSIRSFIYTRNKN